MGSDQTSSEEFASSHDSTASKNSGDSAGKVTFGRTPPHSDDEDRPLPLPEKPNAEKPIPTFKFQPSLLLLLLLGVAV